MLADLMSGSIHLHISGGDAITQLPSRFEEHSWGKHIVELGAEMSEEKQGNKCKFLFFLFLQRSCALKLPKKMQEAALGL